MCDIQLTQYTLHRHTVPTPHFTHTGAVFTTHYTVYSISVDLDRPTDTDRQVHTHTHTHRTDTQAVCWTLAGHRGRREGGGRDGREKRRIEGGGGG